jgi:multiple sugar transport system substrate-binding protein
MPPTVRLPARAIHPPISRRAMLKGAAAFVGYGFVPPTRCLPAEVRTPDRFSSRWTAAKIDWTRHKGKTIVVAAVEHPWTEAIGPLLRHFQVLTGVNVQIRRQSETEYTAELPIKLSTGSRTPDIYMVWAIGQAITAGWLEPLDPFYADPKLSDPMWWDDDDVVASARLFQRWSDGQRYLMPITAEAQVLFINQTMLDARRLQVPTTMDDLYATAVALKRGGVAGMAMRAKSTGDAAWPAGGFIFSYGGAIIDLQGKVALNRPEAVAAVRMYSKLLRDAGPIGVSSYQWTECLNDYMAEVVAMGCDSTNFATDIADPNKSRAAKHTVYALLPQAGDKPRKPNIWHWTLGINSRSANKEAAWLFLQWAASKPTTMLAGAGGLATPRTSVWSSTEFRRRFGEQAAATALTSLETADADLCKATWFHPKGPQILDHFAVAVNEVATGAKEAENALNLAAEKITAVLG